MKNSDLDLECPIQRGDYSLTQTIGLPKEIPPGKRRTVYGIAVDNTERISGKFNVQVEAFSVDGDPLLCLTLHVDFIKSPFLKLPW